MANTTTQYANSILNGLILGSSTLVSDWYLGLYTGIPTTAGNEAIYSGYARQSVTWSTTTGANRSNTNAILFPVINEAHSNITHVALIDAAVGGTIINWRALTTPIIVSPGRSIRWPVGQLFLIAN